MRQSGCARKPAYCATPAGLLAPLYLKWSLAWEDPLSHTLWLAKATPRVWMHEGEVIELRKAALAVPPVQGFPAEDL